MKKTINFLAAVLFVIPASGVLKASDFEKSVKSVEADLALIKINPKLQ